MLDEVTQPRTQNLRVETLSGAALLGALGALADLRIQVFFDFPYLYEGSRRYEEQYLETYVRSERSLVVIVWDEQKAVGASTMLPLADAPADMQQPFLRLGMDLERIAYFGESVLLPAYRGRGLGVRFFELREVHARRLGLTTCAFCAVERPLDHPLRPAGYVPNDAFWTRRGYLRAPHLQTSLAWLDRGASQPTRKDMSFWIKELAK